MDKLTTAIAKNLATNYLGEIEIEIEQGTLRGTSMIHTGDKPVLNLELFPKDEEQSDNPIASWTITLERTN